MNNFIYDNLNKEFNNKIQQYYTIINLHQFFYNYKDEKIKKLLNLNNIIVLDHLLRNVVVFSISILDKYIHSLIIEGIIEIFLGKRPPTNSYYNLKVPIQHFQNFKDKVAYIEYLKNYLYTFFSYKSFQDPDKISEGLSFIWNEKHKWKKIADYCKLEESYIREKLKNIVMRRNQIVHEADINPNTNKEEPISVSNAEDILNFIQVIGNAIFYWVSNQNVDRNGYK